jgi:hypothetical protein
MKLAIFLDALKNHTATALMYLSTIPSVAADLLNVPNNAPPETRAVAWLVPTKTLQVPLPQLLSLVSLGIMPIVSLTVMTMENNMRLISW